MPIGSDIYRDTFMKAHHLERMDPDAEHYVFTIQSSRETVFPDGKKQIVLKFKETDLELGLNRGNYEMCEELFNSEDSDDWNGRKLALHVEIVKNSLAPGGKGPAIRVSMKSTKLANKPKPAPLEQREIIPGVIGRQPSYKQPAPPVTQKEADEIDDDDIPF